MLPTNNINSGEPAPSFPMSTTEAISMISAVASTTPLASSNAAPPATWGDVIEVPLIVLISKSLPIQAEVILDPGAKISTQLPKLEKDERA